MMVRTLVFFLFLECLISLFFHFLEKFLVVGQSFLVDDFSDLSLYSSSDDSVDGILLALYLFLFSSF